MAESGTPTSGSTTTDRTSRLGGGSMLSGSTSSGSAGNGSSISATSGTLGSSGPSLAGSGHGGKPLQQDRHDEASHPPAARAPFYGYGAKEETYRREIDADAQDLEPAQSWADLQARHKPRSSSARDRYLQLQDQTWNQIRARPWLAATVAAGVGLLLGRLYMIRQMSRTTHATAHSTRR